MDWSPSRDFTQQICASYEAEIRRYNLYKGKSGKRWLVADVEDCASWVYVEGNPGSQGFGGREITYTLVDGTEVKLKGPWHTEPQSLFADTGVDIRDRFKTLGCIARDRKYRGKYGHELTMLDVLYVDKEETLGTFKRVEDKAQEMANELGETLYYYSQSSGGSSCGPVKPKKEAVSK